MRSNQRCSGPQKAGVNWRQLRIWKPTSDPSDDGRGEREEVRTRPRHSQTQPPPRLLSRLFWNDFSFFLARRRGKTNSFFFFTKTWVNSALQRQSGKTWRRANWNTRTEVKDKRCPLIKRRKRRSALIPPFSSQNCSRWMRLINWSARLCAFQCCHVSERGSSGCSIYNQTKVDYSWLFYHLHSHVYLQKKYVSESLKMFSHRLNLKFRVLPAWLLLKIK